MRHSAVFVPTLTPDDITGILQFLHSRANAVNAIRIELGKPLEGVVPLIRKAEDFRHQPNSLEGELLVAKMVIAHHREVLDLGDSENCHKITLPSWEAALRRTFSGTSFG